MVYGSDSRLLVVSCHSIQSSFPPGRQTYLLVPSLEDWKLPGKDGSILLVMYSDVLSPHSSKRLGLDEATEQ